jgi:peroxiredoxin
MPLPNLSLLTPGMKRGRLILCSFFVLILNAACHSQTISTAPDETLPDVRGGVFHLRSQPAQPLLLAFLQTVPDTADTPSRSQVVFLSSMAHQYGPRGLRVAVVDASALAPPPSPGAAVKKSSSPSPSRDAVLNASYDWQLKFPLLLDPDNRLARKMGVNQVPTTLLISADGQILHQWSGLTRPAVLAHAIEKLLGGPLAQTPSGMSDKSRVN